MLVFDNYKEPEYKINDDKGIIIGKTEVMLDLFYQLNRLAFLPPSVLLRGETGTGKELCAKALHYNGNDLRKANKFVEVNCAGIPSELLESELFGHVKGSFTGAYKDRIGYVATANGGTILLDEIGDMSLNLQAKVLRMLQERKITKVGSTKSEEIDVRVIAATNRNLEDEVNKGNFREDLYYRLNVIPLIVPNLSERKDDIPLIAEFFIKKYNRIYGSYGIHLEGLSTSAKEKLKWAEWKGNVRELENVIERVFVLRQEGMIKAEHIFFNSDVPTMMHFQQSIVAKSIASKSAASKSEVLKSTEYAPESVSVESIESITEKNEAEHQKGVWFQKGVLPISPLLISKYEGAKPYSIVYRLADNGIIRMIRVGSGKEKRNPLVFLIHKDAPVFFNDQTTEDYSALEARIRNDEFNQIANRPFVFLSGSDLIANPDTLKLRYEIRIAAKEAQAYQVSVGNSTCYAITEANAHYFARRGVGMRHRIGHLQALIRESYEQFEKWN